MVCVGGGPSLTLADLTACRSSSRILAINDACRLVPDADVIFAADVQWWRDHPEAQNCAGLKYTFAPTGPHPPAGIIPLARTGIEGLEMDPSGLRSGGHSGYAAINLAVHLGATRIVLLGYDMQPGPEGQHHWFGEHPNGSHPRYAQWIDLYANLFHLLLERHIWIGNASRETAITGIPRVCLEMALESHPCLC